MNPHNITLRLLLISLIVLAAPTLMASVAHAQNKPAQSKAAQGKPAQGKPAQGKATPSKAAPSKATPSKAAQSSRARKAAKRARRQPAKKVIRVGGSAKQALPKRVTYKQGRDLLHDIQQRSNSIHRKLRDARTRHNDKRVKCLDAKLTQIHTLERVAGREVLALRGAVRSKQDEIAQWRMMRLRIMALRGAELSSEATACGASIRRRNQRTSRTRVRVIKRPRLPRYYDMPQWAGKKRRTKRARKTARQRTQRRR